MTNIPIRLKNISRAIKTDISRFNLNTAKPNKTPILSTPYNATKKTIAEVKKKYHSGVDYTTSEYYILRKLRSDNDYVAQVTHIISQICSTPVPNFMLSSKKDKRDNSTIETLAGFLDKPNNNETWSSLAYKTYDNLVLYGNGYWQIIKNVLGDLHSIYFIPAHTIRPVPFIDSDTGLIRFYYCQVVNWENNTLRIKKVFTDEEIIHFSTPNGDGGIYGKSKFSTLFNKLEFEIESQTWLNSYIENAFSGGMIFEMKNSHPDIVERNRQQFKENLEGGKNAGKNMIMEGEMRLVSEGNKTKDFPLTSLKTLNRDEIFTMAGVPLSIAGLRSDIGDLNPQVIESEEIAFVRNTVEFYQNIFYSTLNLKLITNIMNNDDIEIKRGINRHFSADRNTKLVETSIKTGTTMNEARELLGLPPIDGGDIVVVGTNNGVVPQEIFFENLRLEQEIKKVKLEMSNKDLNKPEDADNQLQTEEITQPSLKISTQEGTANIE